MPSNSKRLRINTEGHRGQSRSLNFVQQKKNGSNKNNNSSHQKRKRRKRSNDDAGSRQHGAISSHSLVQQQQQYNDFIQGGIPPAPTSISSDLSIADTDTDNTLFSSTAVLEDVLCTGSPLFSPPISSNSGLDVVATSGNVVSLTAGVGGGYVSSPNRPKSSCLPQCNDFENYCNGKHRPTQSTPRKIYTNNSCLSQLSTCAIGGISAQLPGGKHRSRFADPSHLKQLEESFAEDEHDISLDLVDLFKEEGKSPPIVGSLCRECDTDDTSYDDWVYCAGTLPFDYSRKALLEAGDADEERINKALINTFEHFDPNYNVNRDVIEKIKNMPRLPKEEILKLKKIKKAEVENAIKESLVHWEQQPDCDNKLAQVKYLHESVDSIKEAMDELQAQGRPVLVVQCICSTPECEGLVDGSNWGSSLCKKKFDKCKSIIGLKKLTKTFIDMGLSQAMIGKKIPVLVRNVRKCDLTSEYIAECRAKKQHWACRCSDPLERRTNGALLKPFLELAVLLGVQTILVEAAGNGEGKKLLPHVGMENVSVEISGLYHVQFWAWIHANMPTIRARAMNQLLNISITMKEFCSAAGIEQDGLSFVERFCQHALPNDTDFGTTMAKAILAKAGANKIGKCETTTKLSEQEKAEKAQEKARTKEEKRLKAEEKAQEKARTKEEKRRKAEEKAQEKARTKEEKRRKAEEKALAKTSPTSHDLDKSVEKTSKVLPSMIKSNDVICGRSREARNHPGNMQYNKIVSLNKNLYTTCKTSEKSNFSKSIVTAVREAGVRFLEQLNDGSYRDIGDRRAVEKTSQALREGQPNRTRLLAENQEGGSISAVIPNLAVGNAEAAVSTNATAIYPTLPDMLGNTTTATAGTSRTELVAEREAMVAKKARDTAKFVSTKAKAENRDANGMVDLAKMYLFGEGTTKDERKAFHWFDKASNYSEIAIAWVADCYLLGLGVEKDYDEGYDYLFDSASGGEVPSILRLWHYHNTGALGVEQDSSQAEKYLDQLEELLNGSDIKEMKLELINDLKLLEAN